MSFANSTPIQYRLYGDGGGASDERWYQVLEVRIRYFRRVISGSQSPGVPPQILHETTPISLNNALFHFCRRQLQDPVFYVRQWLSSLNIRAAACEIIALQIATYILQMAAGNVETNFHIVAEVDFIRVIWMERHIPGLVNQGGSNDGALMEETVILEEALPARRGVPESAMEKVRMWRLKENGEELGDCSICLDELKCSKGEVIRIPCEHVYHESCISKWLKSHNSCPLCRRALPLED